MAASRTGTRRGSKAAAPVVDEVEVDEELEELEEDEVAEGSTRKQQEVTFGVADLCALIKKRTGKDVKPRELRTLIRKMAREDNPRVDRVITPGNRTRYDWPAGIKDPEVKKIVAAFEGGELEADKQAKLAALKESKAAKKAAAPAETKGKRRRQEPVVEELDDEDEELELDDEDDED